MGDMGDYYRDYKEMKRRARDTWHDCQGGCGARFGTPTKVPPGGTCRHDGWQAPNEPANGAAIGTDDAALLGHRRKRRRSSKRR